MPITNFPKQIHTNLIEELAFLIPVRVDSEDRLFNLRTVLSFLNANFPKAEVIIVEQDFSSQLDKLLINFPVVNHIFCKSEIRFKKAEAVNLGAQSTNRKYICMYDTDILLHPDAVNASLNAMSRWKWRLVVPFNRIFLDIKGDLRNKVSATLDLTGLCQITKLSHVPKSENIKARFLNGGVFIADREVFLAEGGLNQKMVSYGWEDTEIFQRFRMLGYHVLHIEQFNLIHLDHIRGNDSQPNEYYDQNKSEYLKICSMNKNELKNYVEKELSITTLGNEKKLRILRNIQFKANILGFLYLRALLNLLKIKINGMGVRNFLFSYIKPR